ncbi:MAG: hypothetical protein JWN46_1903 [Acidimicrobiales bacterium]|nr:hypothetical protein [Acidimicrobiales bacterium]
MADDRFVVLALGHVRSPWFVDVARWATAGSLPIELVKCVSAEEVRARLTSGRIHSAVLLDGRLTSVDRDLLDGAATAGCPPIVVADRDLDWVSLGAAAVVEPPVSRGALLDALHQCAVPVKDVEAVPTSRAPLASPGWRGRLVAVTGRGGSGRSTLAAAVAQGLAADPRRTGGVVLIDACLHADQAVLHDARDVVPGLPELIEAHRSGVPSAEAIRLLTFTVHTRGYALLLGLRRHRDWAGIRPRSWEAALEGLLGAHRVVVADVDADLEGDVQTGSIEVEDRNRLARSTMASADVVVAIGLPGVSGLHGLVATTAALIEHDVAPERIVALVNRAPRHPRARAELTRAFAELSLGTDPSGEVVGPVFVPDRRGTDELHRDIARLPQVLTGPITGAVQALLDRLTNRAGHRNGAPLPIAPGSLGLRIGSGEAR